MSVIFFFPLLAIAVFETHFDPSRRSDYLALTQAPVEYTPEDEDPEAWYDTDEYGPGENREAKIATVPFAQLKENLPLVARSQQAEILYQVFRPFLDDVADVPIDQAAARGVGGDEKISDVMACNVIGSLEA